MLTWPSMMTVSDGGVAVGVAVGVAMQVMIFFSSQEFWITLTTVQARDRILSEV